MKINRPKIAAIAALTGFGLIESVDVEGRVQAVLQKQATVSEAILNVDPDIPIIRTPSKNLRIVAGANLFATGAGLGLGEMVGVALFAGRKRRDNGIQTV